MAVLLLLTTRCSSTDRAETRNLAACSATSVDTTGWVRQRGPYHGFSYRVPPTFTEDTSGLFMHGGTAWRDGSREFHSVNGYWGPMSFRLGYNGKPGAERSECWASVGGLRVLIATQYWEGKYAASGWFLDPRPTEGYKGMEVVLRGLGTSSHDQHLMLAILRTVVADSAG